MKDKYYMKLAFSEAIKGNGKVSPNPMVGAVIVKNNKIIGKGYHKIFGGNHAEINALKNCTQSPIGASLYINLEPCCHFGKTPPCTKAIIKSGIKKVVISNIDPNTIVSGKGILELKKAGIKIILGILENEGKILNEKYFKYIKTKIPFVTLKAAITIDGKIYSKDFKEKYISCKESRKTVHKLRSENQAVLVGINTILMDNPHLGLRLIKGKEPVRIILDTNLKIPENSNVLRDSRVIIFTKISKSKKKSELEKKGISILTLKTLTIKNILKELGKIGIASVLVEGGAKVFSSFIKENLADKYVFFITPYFFGEKKSLSVFDYFSSIIKQIKISSIKKMDKDLFIEAYNK
jgi:diaminohydroxyphosphoribosylaminopyrimidine deaminase / 5-amino-6-(5-phosphoribosylamino)uracil reductase